MLAVIYMLTATFAGIAIMHRLFPQMTSLGRIASGHIAGVVLSAWIAFSVAWLTAWATWYPLHVGVLVSIAVLSAVGVWLGREMRPSQFKMTNWEKVGLACALAFSFWFIGGRLSGDPLTVSREPWADVAYHITILRSFSEGHNYPPEFPFFGNETMRYHFGTDFYAAALEVGGLPVEWTLNLPGALGFAAMMVFIFEIGRLLFRSIWVGVISVVLLITNGSLAFLRYLQKYDYDIGEAISNFWDHTGYLAIGPYTLTGDPPDRISIFWTPNIWMTQTQLVLGMAVVLFVTFGLLVKLKNDERFTIWQGGLLGAVMGGMFWINGVLYVPAIGFMLVLLVLFRLWPLDLSAIASGVREQGVVESVPRLGGALFRRVQDALYFAVPAVGLAIPQMVWLNAGTGGEAVDFHLGYLVCTTPRATDCYPDVNSSELLDPSTWVEFVRYWWLNLGLVLPLLILGAIWAKEKERRVWLAVMSIFVFGNLFALGRDLGGHGHKIFNLWEILISVFAAYAFVRLWNLVDERHQPGPPEDRGTIRQRGRAGGDCRRSSLCWCLSGLIDFMTVKNDPRFGVFPQGNTIAWIQDETPRDAMFLTQYGDPYTTPALAGRTVFWGGFEPWTADKGHETEPRRQIIQSIYGAPDKATACALLIENDIQYVQVGPWELNAGKFPVNQQMFQSEFVQAYHEVTPDGQEITYYNVPASCPSDAAVAGG